MSLSVTIDFTYQGECVTRTVLPIPPELEEQVREWAEQERQEQEKPKDV